MEYILLSLARKSKRCSWKIPPTPVEPLHASVATLLLSSIVLSSASHLVFSFDFDAPSQFNVTVGETVGGCSGFRSVARHLHSSVDLDLVPVSPYDARSSLFNKTSLCCLESSFPETKSSLSEGSVVVSRCRIMSFGNDSFSGDYRNGANSITSHCVFHTGGYALTSILSLRDSASVMKMMRSAEMLCFIYIKVVLLDLDLNVITANVVLQLGPGCHHRRTIILLHQVGYRTQHFSNQPSHILHVTVAALSLLRLHFDEA